MKSGVLPAHLLGTKPAEPRDRTQKFDSGSFGEIVSGTLMILPPKLLNLCVLGQGERMPFIHH